MGASMSKPSVPSCLSDTIPCAPPELPMKIPAAIPSSTSNFIRPPPSVLPLNPVLSTSQRNTTNPHHRAVRILVLRCDSLRALHVNSRQTSGLAASSLRYAAAVMPEPFPSVATRPFWIRICRSAFLPIPAFLVKSRMPHACMENSTLQDTASRDAGWFCPCIGLSSVARTASEEMGNRRRQGVNPGHRRLLRARRSTPQGGMSL